MNLTLAADYGWIGKGRPDPQRPHVSMCTVLLIRRWVEALLEMPTVLCIERIGERNRVALSVVGLGECEVSRLKTLHKECRRVITTHAKRRVEEALRCGVRENSV